MPFGLTTAPSVYQSINNVLASLMRQYLIPNVLYIGLLVKFHNVNMCPNYLCGVYFNNPSFDDRCIVCEPGEEYLGWLITSLSTSCGHYLSLHKTNVKKAKPIFTYLGFEFDCPKVGGNRFDQNSDTQNFRWYCAFLINEN